MRKGAPRPTEGDKDLERGTTAPSLREGDGVNASSWRSAFNVPKPLFFLSFSSGSKPSTLKRTHCLFHFTNRRGELNK